jgi:hypothetical protein
MDFDERARSLAAEHPLPGYMLMNKEEQTGSNAPIRRCADRRLGALRASSQQQGRDDRRLLDDCLGLPMLLDRETEDDWCQLVNAWMARWKPEQAHSRHPPFGKERGRMGHPVDWRSGRWLGQPQRYGQIVKEPEELPNVILYTPISLMRDV